MNAVADAGDEGNIVRNVNPPLPNNQFGPPKNGNPRKPEGSVFESHNMAGIFKNMKQPGDVKLSIKGVNQATLARFINANWKASPFVGIPYNKRLLELNIRNTVETKNISDNIKLLTKGTIVSSKNIVELSQKILNSKKDIPNKPDVTAKVLDSLVKETVSENRRKILKDREDQKYGSVNYEAEQVAFEKENNALLRSILKGDQESLKNSKKKSTSMLGDFFGKSNVGGLSSLLSKMFANPLMYAGLTGATVVAGAEIVRACKLGAQALKDMVEAWRREQKHEDMISAALAGTKERLIQQGQNPEDAAAFEKLSKELDFMQSQLNQPFDRWKTAIKLGIIKPEETYAGAALTGGKALSESEREVRITQAVEQKRKEVKELKKKIDDHRNQNPPGQTTNSSDVVGGDVQSAFNSIVKEFNMSPAVATNFAKLIGGESSWDPQKVNPHSGTKGLIQFSDQTAKELGFKDAQDLITQYPDAVSQLMGPVKNYLKMKNLPQNPNEQQLDMSVLLPTYMNKPSNEQFKDKKYWQKKYNKDDTWTGDYLATKPQDYVDYVNRQDSIIPTMAPITISPEIDKLQKITNELKNNNNVQEQEQENERHSQVLEALGNIYTAVSENTDVTGSQKITQMNRITTSLAG